MVGVVAENEIVEKPDELISFDDDLRRFFDSLIGTIDVYQYTGKLDVNDLQKLKLWAREFQKDLSGGK